MSWKFVCGLGPHERLWAGVGVGDAGSDRRFQIARAGEDTALEPAAAQERGPAFGQVEPSMAAQASGLRGCWDRWRLDDIGVPSWRLSKVTSGAPSAMEMTTIGRDLTTHVYQVHGITVDGSVVLEKRLRHRQAHAFFAGLAPCLVGMGVCATHTFWAR